MLSFILSTALLLSLVNTNSVIVGVIQCLYWRYWTGNENGGGIVCDKKNSMRIKSGRGMRQTISNCDLGIERAL